MYPLIAEDLRILEGELTSYSLMDVEGRIHREMMEVIQEFANPVQVRIISIENLKTKVDEALERVQ